jgi:hypothetical protein
MVASGMSVPFFLFCVMSPSRLSSTNSNTMFWMTLLRLFRE